MWLLNVILSNTAQIEIKRIDRNEPTENMSNYSMSRSLPTCNRNKKVDRVSSVININRRARYIVQNLSSLLMKALHIKYSAIVCDRNIVVISRLPDSDLVDRFWKSTVFIPNHSTLILAHPKLLSLINYSSPHGTEIQKFMFLRLELRLELTIKI